MSDYSSLNISAMGLGVEKLRLDITSLNISNQNTAARVGEGYVPKHLVSAMQNAGQFDALLNYQQIDTTVQVLSGDVKQVYEPNHPLANSQGYVEYPDINPLTEMMNLMSATRSYEANAKAFTASRVMFDETLKLGK